MGYSTLPLLSHPTLMLKIIVINQLKYKTGGPAVAKAVEDALDKTAQLILQDFFRPTKSWEHTPLFEVESAKETRTIFTTDPIYVWLNFGTKRSGTVTPVNKKALHLPASFIPATRPNDLFGYQGEREYADGVNVFKSVRKSSIRPRHFDEQIFKQYAKGGSFNLQDYFQRKINEALAVA